MRSKSRTASQDGQELELTFTERARRAQVVESAIETIAELGFARASLAEIGRRAGISKGLISYHFAGKAELIERVVAQVLDTAAAVMVPRIEAASGARGELSAYIASNLEFMQTHRSYIVAVVEIFNASPRAGEGQPAPYAAHYAEVVGRLEDLLRAGQESGELRPFSTRVMAVTIRAAIDAAGYRLSSDPDLDMGAYASELVESFDRAVRSDAARTHAHGGRT